MTDDRFTNRGASGARFLHRVHPQWPSGTDDAYEPSFCALASDFCASDGA